MNKILEKFSSYLNPKLCIFFGIIFMIIGGFALKFGIMKGIYIEPIILIIIGSLFYVTGRKLLNQADNDKE
jgi:hypothetical protein